MQLLKQVFRLLLVAFSVLFPLPSFPLQYYAVGTVQEYTLPKGPEGTNDPAVAYWQHTVQSAETWLADAKRGLYHAECEEADILASDCVDLWLIEQPGRWERLLELGVEVRPGDGRVNLSSPFPLAGRDLVIFRELSGTFDPQGFNARDWFEDWPPPL
jgi:hypothetical protein